MYQSLDIFRTASAMARHAGNRQALTAQNVANADTPGYRAQELASFAETYQSGGGGLRPTSTRAGHLAGTLSETSPRPGFAPGEASPNGNTVSIETEMLRATEIEREHGRALAIYRHAMTVLRTVVSG